MKKNITKKGKKKSKSYRLTTIATTCIEITQKNKGLTSETKAVELLIMQGYLALFDHIR